MSEPRGEERFSGIPLSVTQQLVMMSLLGLTPPVEIFVHVATSEDRSVFLIFDRPGGERVATISEKDGEWMFSAAGEVGIDILRRADISLSLLRLEYGI